MSDLEEIQRRADAATPGLWVHAGSGYVEVPPAFNLDRFDEMGETVARVELQDADAEFIAHARTDVPALLALLRQRDATLAAVLELANARGRCGWNISSDEIRKALRA